MRDWNEIYLGLLEKSSLRRSRSIESRTYLYSTWWFQFILFFFHSESGRQLNLSSSHISWKGHESVRTRLSGGKKESQQEREIPLLCSAPRETTFLSPNYDAFIMDARHMALTKAICQRHDFVFVCVCVCKWLNHSCCRFVPAVIISVVLHSEWQQRRLLQTTNWIHLQPDAAQINWRTKDISLAKCGQVLSCAAFFAMLSAQS